MSMVVLMFSLVFAIHPHPEPVHQPAPGKEEDDMDPAGNGAFVTLRFRCNILQLGRIGIIVGSGSEIILLVESQLMRNDIPGTDYDSDRRKDGRYP